MSCSGSVDLSLLSIKLSQSFLYDSLVSGMPVRHFGWALVEDTPCYFNGSLLSGFASFAVPEVLSLTKMRLCTSCVTLKACGTPCTSGLTFLLKGSLVEAVASVSREFAISQALGLLSSSLIKLLSLAVPAALPAILLPGILF